MKNIMTAPSSFTSRRNGCVDKTTTTQSMTTLSPSSTPLRTPLSQRQDKLSMEALKLTATRSRKAYRSVSLDSSMLRGVTNGPKRRAPSRTHSNVSACSDWSAEDYLDESSTSFDLCSPGMPPRHYLETPIRSSVKAKIQALSPNCVLAPPPLLQRAEGACGDSRVRVQFGKLTVREYDIVLGDNPATVSGPGLSIGWDYTEHPKISIEGFEKLRTRKGLSSQMSKRDKKKKKGTTIRFSKDERCAILKRLGYTDSEIAEAVRRDNKVRHARQRSVDQVSSENAPMLGAKMFKFLLSRGAGGDAPSR